MKKKLKNKSIILLITIIINTTIIIILSVFLSSNAIKNVKYDPISGEETPIINLSRGYEIHRGNFTTFTIMEANLLFTQEPVKDYTLNVCTLRSGDKFIKGDKIGSINNQDIFAPEDGCVIVNIKQDNEYKLTIYLYNQFKVILKIDENQYYDDIMHKINTPRLYLSDTIFFDLNYQYVDLAYYINEGFIGVIYNIDVCEAIITNNTYYTFKSIDKIYNNVYYLINSPFKFTDNVQIFKVIENNKIKYVYVNCDEIIDNIAIVSVNPADDFVLYLGLYLYD